ncbi:MAG: hypothetical protein CML07_08115 [Psychrobacter sp.]|nr:hypothetical protein [Psychrobacter sp.]
MSYFVVQRDLPGITPDQLTGAGLRAKTCAAEMSQEGQPLRWLRSYFLPEKEQTHCYFEGPNIEAVKELNQRAQIPFSSIFEVQELTPEVV